MQTPGFAQVPQLMAEQKLTTAQAWGVPMTVFFGESPSGLRSGDSDLDHWYDKLEDYREREYLPSLEILLSAIFNAANGPTQGVEPEGWEIDPKAFGHLDQKEEAETDKVRAETLETLVNTGVVTAEEARATLKREGVVELETGPVEGPVAPENTPGTVGGDPES